MNLSAKEISGLPTIIDVLEMLAERENVRRISNPKELHPWKMLEEGHFMPISADSNRNLGIPLKNLILVNMAYKNHLVLMLTNNK